MVQASGLSGVAEEEQVAACIDIVYWGALSGCCGVGAEEEEGSLVRADLPGPSDVSECYLVVCWVWSEGTDCYLN